MLIQDALRAAADAPGYPTVHGTPALREAIAGWFARRRGVPGLDPQNVMPTVGSKELVAWLPFLLGLKPGDVVVRPTVAYPTYDIGATFAGAERSPRTTWTNSTPPPGPGCGWSGSIPRATPPAASGTSLRCRQIVGQAREIGAVVASDECYAELGWGEWDAQRGGEPVPSVLDPQVAGGSHDGLLAVYSLSKQSNVAGYRAAFVAGDPAIMANLVNSRKHAGMIVPYPVQEAMRVALGDDAHVAGPEGPVPRPARTARARAAELRPGDPRVQGRPVPVGHRRRGDWDTVGRLADRDRRRARACSTATPATGSSGWR